VVAKEVKPASISGIKRGNIRNTVMNIRGLSEEGTNLRGTVNLEET
jgi:hypothetical protein